MENKETFESVPFICKILEFNKKVPICSEENIPSEFLAEIKAYHLHNNIIRVNIVSSISPYDSICDQNFNKKVIYKSETQYCIQFLIDKANENYIKNMLVELIYRHFIHDIEYIHSMYTVPYENMFLPSIHALYFNIKDEEILENYSLKFSVNIPIIFNAN